MPRQQGRRQRATRRWRVTAGEPSRHTRQDSPVTQRQDSPVTQRQDSPATPRQDSPAPRPGDREPAGSRRGGRIAVAAAAGGALVIGAGTVAASQGALPFSSSSVPAALTRLASAPDCVRDQLALLNTNVTRHGHSLAVVEIPATPKVVLSNGLTRGMGWRGVTLVRSLATGAYDLPSGDFALWEGVTPADDLSPGRHLVSLYVDAAPRVPGGTLDTAIWGFNVTHLPVTGEEFTVTCPDGTSARLSLDDDRDSWLGRGAPTVPSNAPPAVPRRTVSKALGRGEGAECPL